MRRNVDYKRDVEKWLTLAAETHRWELDRFRSYCRREGGTVDYPPRGSESENYRRDCTKWGLKFLILPEIKIAAEEMSGSPIFKDTPAWQFVVKDEGKLKKRVRRLPDHSQGRAPGTPGDLLEELNREDHERVKRGEPPAGYLPRTGFMLPCL